MDLYDINALQISRLSTRNYSTSFSLGVATLQSEYRMPVYAIYGFVRFADEIVDTFHQHNQKKLLENFRKDTFEAIDERISTNPILHSYQWVVNEFNIDHELIHAFLDSMEMDLKDKNHTAESFKKYVYGSAEVVGLMCLRVFYKDDDEAYEKLKLPARKLGEAFQKINFLRDIQSDHEDRGRFYFPGVNLDQLNNEIKQCLEEDIQSDFNEAFDGIQLLNKASRLGVLISYTYYLKLFQKIKKTNAQQLLRKRYRIPNWRKLLIYVSVWTKFKLGLA
jgi:phytoene/squalene synthetase